MYFDNNLLIIIIDHRVLASNTQYRNTGSNKKKYINVEVNVYCKPLSLFTIL